MTDRELLAKLQGYLAANLDRGLTREQVQECLEMLRQPTVPAIGPTWPYPLEPWGPKWPWWEHPALDRRPVITTDNTSTAQ